VKLLVFTDPPTYSLGGQYCFSLWRLSSSVAVVCNTPRRRNLTHQGAARYGGPVVLRPVRATPCLKQIDSNHLTANKTATVQTAAL